jgi:hypothetical protein
MEIRQLKAVLVDSEARARELVAQANQLGAALEDAADENTALRQRAGLPPGTAVDAAGVRQAREVAIAQLRSVNAMLERQVRGGLAKRYSAADPFEAACPQIQRYNQSLSRRHRLVAHATCCQAAC